jgi:hypothetical protein
MTITPPPSPSPSTFTIITLIFTFVLVFLVGILVLTHLDNQAILDCISAGHTPSECHAVIN